MKFFTKEVKIALTAIVGIVILFYGLEFLKGLTVFSTDDSYYIAFDDVSGLSASSPVYANGYRVGVVKEINYDYTHQQKIVAVMGLNNEMRLPKGTHAEIDSDLLGNIKINLVLGDNPIDLLAEGDTIPGGAVQGMMARVGAMMPAIEAMMPCRVWRVSGEELVQFFNRSIKNMKLRADIGEHMLNQFKARYQDFHRATPHERYDQLLSRCPGIVEHLPLNAIASFLNVTPQMLSRIRKDLLLRNGE